MRNRHLISNTKFIADLCPWTYTCHQRINNLAKHDDVIKWKHFSRSWSFVRGIHRSPANSPYKGQWRGALMFSFRGVARRRPRGPGLNLKMQKKNKSENSEDPCLHEIQYCHIKHLSLLLAAIKSPDTTYITLYIFVSTHSYMIFCQQLTEWSFITIISDVSTILWLITLVKDIYMLCKECYAAWWLMDDKSQASIRRDILQDPQNIPGVAPEGLLNKLF